MQLFELWFTISISLLPFWAGGYDSGRVVRERSESGRAGSIRGGCREIWDRSPLFGGVADDDLVVENQIRCPDKLGPRTKELIGEIRVGRLVIDADSGI